MKHYLVFVSALCLLGACGSTPKASPMLTSSPMPTPHPTPTSQVIIVTASAVHEPCHVIYKVYGTAHEAYVSWTTPALGPGIPGVYEIIPHLVTAPWEEKAYYDYCWPSTRLDVEFTSDSAGSLTCELWVDGELKDAETKTGGSFACGWCWQDH